MTYRGDIALGSTIDIKFTTRRFSTGAPFTLAGSPAVAAYVDNGTTEITAGVTLSVDFDGRTGLNNVRVVATSGNGFATATNVALVITAGTVDSISVVGEVVGAFSIEARSGLRPTTAGRTLDVSTTGEAGVDWANVGSPTTAQNLSGTNIATNQVVASVSGAVGSVTGAVGSVTGNVGGNVTGSVGSVAANGISATSIATGAITAAKFGANAIDAAALASDAGTEIGTAVWATPTRLLTAGTNIVLAKGTGVTGFNDISAAGAAAAVWDEILSGHVIVGSAGAALSAAGGSGDPWATALPGAYGAGTAGKIIGDNINATVGSRATQTSVDDVPTNAELATALGTADDAVLAQVALVKAKTDNLPTDPADHSDIIIATNALATLIGDVPTNAELATALGTADDAVLAQVALVKAKTDSLTFTVAGKVDANPTAINGDATAAANLAKTTRAIGRGTVTAGASATSIPTSVFTPSGAVADQFKGRIVTFDADTTTAALRGQSTDIVSSTGAATPTLTVTALSTVPATGDTFSVT